MVGFFPKGLVNLGFPRDPGPVPQRIAVGVRWAIPSLTQLPVASPWVVTRRVGGRACRPLGGRSEGTSCPK
eukprot:8758937-Heterocapsa_arctica.AAC.1